MSSCKFEAVLCPEARLRKLLLTISVAATLIGALLIARLPLLFGYQAAFACLWSLAGWLELKGQCSGVRRVHTIVLYSDGRLEGASADGKREPLQLRPGSVVLARMAWLRLRFANGREYGELLTPRAATSRDWQRLQLVWRQRASIFGRAEVS